MLHRVALVRTDVSEELSASFIRVPRIGELGTTLAVTNSVRRLLVTASVVPSSPILVTLMKEALRGSKMLRIPHCLDSRIRDVGKIVSLTRRPALYSPETLFFCF
jgi:hypothetical protein